MRVEQLGSYELERRLGVGGMAETFIAVRRGHAGFSQRVCLKRILPAFSADKTFVELFMEEARIAAALRHSNVVGVIDFGVIEGTYFMALELVEGADLRQILQSVPGGKLGIQEATYVAMELAHALDHAHRHSMETRGTMIVHRDISPSNVLVSSAGEVKLTDFGIAKAMHTASATQSTGLKGKIAYMAPEQASGKTVDARTDLFALGIVLYECLAGRRPFDGATEMETFARVLAGRYTPLREMAPQLPEPLVVLVERLLSFEPSDRIQSAAELIDALAPFVAGPITRRSLGELAGRAGKQGMESGAAAFDAADTVHAAGPPPAIEASSTEPVVPAVAASTPPGSASSPHVGRVSLSTDPVASPSPDGAAVFVTPHVSPRSPSRRRLYGLAALVAVLALIGVVGAKLSLSRRVPAPIASTSSLAPAVEAASSPSAPLPAASNVPSSPVDEASLAQDQAAVPPSSEGDGSASTNRRPRRESPSATPVVASAPASDEDDAIEGDRTRAVVQIGVFPWGEVWIDGQLVGPTPVRVTLPPGRHVIEAGAGSPEQRRVIRVRAGQVERVMFNLRE